MSKVLITVDMQRDFIDGVLGTPEAYSIVEPVAEYIKSCREDGFIIITTRDDHGADYEDTKEGAVTPEHCLRWEDGFMPAPEIKDAIDPDDDYCICKQTFGAIELVNLLYVIDEEEPINEIRICGLQADKAVLANAVLIASAFPEVHIHVLRDLCAGSTPKATCYAFKVMRGLLIDVVNTHCLHCDTPCECYDCEDIDDCEIDPLLCEAYDFDESVTE